MRQAMKCVVGAVLLVFLAAASIQAAPLPKRASPQTQPVEVAQSAVESKVAPTAELKPAAPVAQVVTEQDKRLPLPTEEEQQRGLAAAKDVFGESFKAAKTADQKHALAEKVLKSASDSKDDPVGQYVLLRLAKDIAIAAGDLDVAMKAAEQMGAKYRLDPYQTKLEALLACSKHATNLKQKTSLAGRAFRLVPEAVACDDFENAKKLCGMARQIRDRELAQQAAVYSKELNQIATAFAGAESSIAKLKQNPDDPEANALAGRYQCFVKGNWAQGLPLLAQGNDEEIKSIAASEVDGGIGKDLALADQWWAVSESLSGREREVVQLHAADLYRKAAPQLTGLEKARVEKRLAEVKTTVVLTAEGAAKLATLISSLPSGAICVLTFEPNTFTAQGNRVFVKDLSGKNNHGEVIGAAMSDGKVGKGIEFTGKSALVLDGLYPTGSAPRTVCLWIKANEQKLKEMNTSVFVWGTVKGEPTNSLWLAFVRGAAGRTAWLASHFRGETGGVADLAWHHHVLSYDGTKVKYYCDGRPGNENPVALSTNAGLSIGPRTGTTFLGVVDEFVVFDRALTDEEVKQVYELGANGQNLVRRER